MTTLAGMAVTEIDIAKLNILPNALEAITEWIAMYIKNNPVANLPNSTLIDEWFGRHWTNKQYETFRSRFQSYADWIKDAIDYKDHDNSEKLWQNIFGPKYQRNNRDRDKENSETAVSKSEVDPA